MYTLLMMIFWMDCWFVVGNDLFVVCLNCVEWDFVENSIFFERELNLIDLIVFEKDDNESGVICFVNEWLLFDFDLKKKGNLFFSDFLIFWKRKEEKKLFVYWIVCCIWFWFLCLEMNEKKGICLFFEIEKRNEGK